MDRMEFDKRFIAARRAAIALDFAHLNDVQREAVMATSGPLLLLAGAGSGKTTVLINRIANLLKYGNGSDSGYVPGDATEDDLFFLEEYISEGTRILKSGAQKVSPDGPQGRVRSLCAVDPVEPWRIIAITFTNKAAGEMKERLERMLGRGADDIWAMTFHSACARMLRRDIDRLGYDRSFTIYDTSDTASLMKRILKDLNIDEKNLPHKTILGYISRAKDAMIDAGEFHSSADKTGDMRRKLIGRAYLEYESRMKSSNALDFDDLILLTVRLLWDNPDIMQYYQNRFKHVLVDEYQDTNNLQYLLASALAGGYKNICVVGDDDQSIYKFRGATIENILSFEERFKNTRVIRLEQNYRSTGYILDAANDVIRNNKGRKGKKLWTEKNPGEKPALHVVSDERSEAQFVADTIIASHADGSNWNEHAVLYRMNAQSNQLETAFKRNGIPYRIFGGTGFYDRAEIKDMLAYLCIIHNPHDDVRLLRVINNPPRGIGDTSVGRLAELAAVMNCSLFDAIRHSQNSENLKSAAGRMHLFADMIDGLRELTGTAPLDVLYDALLSRTGYIRMLEEKGTDENISRIENVRELKTNIISFMNENGGSLFDFLNETALYTDLDRDDSGTDRVFMMTMHSAKGLEFDAVFIVGAEEGVFPGVRAIGEPGDMEEERRLCYVAMTRAMRRLYFISALRRMLFGKTSPAQPSRFLGEISGENIDIHEQYEHFGDYDPDFEYSGGYRGYRGAARNPAFSSPQYPAFRTQNSTFRTAHTTPSEQSSTFHTTHSTPSRQNSTLRTTHSALHRQGDTGTGFKKGDTIKHTAFGRGVITDLTPGGGDILLEIAFDDTGTKRMLLNSAARYMTKI